MPLNVQLVNAQVKDPQSGQMTPAGLIGSDAISTINTAKNQAIAAVQQKGEETLQSIPDDYTALSNEVDDVKTQLNDMYDVVAFKIEIDTLNKVVPFYVDSGDVLTVKAKNGSAMTVDRLYLRREDNTTDYRSLSGYETRTFDITEKFVSVFLSAGTAQDIVIEKTGSYLNFQPQIDELKNASDKNTTSISDLNNIVGKANPTYQETSGYISSSGVITSGASFRYSAPIPVYEGQKVSLLGRGYNTALAMISLCDVNGANIVPKVISIDTTLRTYEYDVTADGYIIVSYSINAEHELTIYNRTVERAVEKINAVISENIITPSNLNSGYIHRDGRIMEASNFRYTNPIRLENEVITFHARGYSDSVSLLSVCDENGNNRINIVNSTSEEVEKDVEYVSNGVTYIIISSSQTVPIVYKTRKSIIPHDIQFVNLSMFQKFGVVGDSFASGALFFNSTEKDDYAHSWGQIMARNLGTTCTNYSKGGLSTRTWLTDNKGLSLLLANDPEEIYYLVLGINDAYSLGTSYLGTISDITSHESYIDYPDTFFGNYGKIIEQILEHAPNAKLVMFTTPHTSANAVLFNAAIIEIAEHYEIPYIVQRNDSFITSSFYWDNMVEGHPIAIGYSGMASAFERLLSDCIKNNVNYFKNTFWYN